MALVLVTPPATQPVSLTEAKLHLRVSDTTEDTLITALIAAARERAEAITPARAHAVDVGLRSGRVAG